jgi:hypothetical protein
VVAESADREVEKVVVWGSKALPGRRREAQEGSSLCRGVTCIFAAGGAATFWSWLFCRVKR